MNLYKTLYSNAQLVYKINRLNFSLIFLIKIIQGFVPALNLILLQNLVNSVQDIITKPNKSVLVIVVLLLSQFILQIFNSIIGNLESYLQARLQSDVELNLKSKIAKKLFKIKYQDIESFEFQNLVQRTQGDLGSRMFQPISQSLDLISTLVTMVTISLFLLQFHWIFIFIVIAFSIPIIVIQSRFGKERYFLVRFQTPAAREQNYLFDIFSDRKYNKEIRLTMAQKYLVSKWKNIFNKNRQEILNQEFEQQKKIVLLDGLTGISYIIACLYLVWMIVNKAVKIGDFISISESIQRLQNATVSCANIYSNILESVYFLNDLNILLNHDEDNEGDFEFPKKLQKGIKIENFTFRYPESDIEVLKNINLTISQNSSLVIVGENGSGKSTLIKCLSGLYDVDEECVYYDNLDISNIEKSSLNKNLSVVHQDFVRYELTLKENIILGDIHNDYTDKHLDSIIQSVDAKDFVKDLPNKIDTRLGKMFSESQDLSGGQWQKVALARAMIKESQILILDEATSALDPETEINTFLKFKELAQNKTSIFISHRMYSCHLADYIAVMKKGEIVEYGTFDQLINKGEYFYDLYQKQANMYTSHEGVTS